MANRHRRHSSLDTLGWIYTNRAREEPPAPPHDRSISTRISSFRREAFPTTGGLKRQSSLRFNPGEYLTGCFGPHGDSRIPTERTTTSGRPPRSRSISLGNFEFDFGSMRFKEKGDPRLAVRAAELNHQAATHKQRVAQPGARWVMEDDAEYYLKPPAWKQALRKLQAQAKRHVHPFPPARELSPVNYDAESYEKNFDDGGRYMGVDEEVDEFGVRARIRHSKLLTKLHSQRFEGDHEIGHEFPPSSGKIVKAMSVPAVLPVAPVGTRPHHGVPIWERRVAARPITNLELTRSI